MKLQHYVTFEAVTGVPLDFGYKPAVTVDEPVLGEQPGVHSFEDIRVKYNFGAIVAALVKLYYARMMLCLGLFLIGLLTFSLCFVPSLIFQREARADSSRRILALSNLAGVLVSGPWVPVGVDESYLWYACHLGFMASTMGQAAFRTLRAVQNRPDDTVLL